MLVARVDSASRPTHLASSTRFSEAHRIVLAADLLVAQFLLTFASVISQNNTWSPLNVSSESFDQIVNAHSLSDNIYDVVQAFRHRRGEILQFRWSACRVQLGSPRINYYGQSIAV